MIRVLLADDDLLVRSGLRALLDAEEELTVVGEAADGRQVDLRTTDVELPAPTARAVYRIAQEALTNAVKHTPAGRIRVAVDRRGSAVVLEVVNDCAPVAQPSSGHGLVNMRERARLEGGELEAGPVAGGFRVHAVLRVAAGVPS